MAQPETISATPPGVVTWFKIYAGFLCLIYAICIVIGLGFLLLPSVVVLNSRDFPPLFAYIYGVVITGIGVIFLVGSAVPFFLKPRPSTWIYDLVVICLGMTSACTLPFSIALLVFWLKPETKQYFGKVN